MRAGCTITSQIPGTDRAHTILVVLPFRANVSIELKKVGTIDPSTRRGAGVVYDNVLRQLRCMHQLVPAEVPSRRGAVHGPSQYSNLHMWSFGLGAMFCPRRYGYEYSSSTFGPDIRKIIAGAPGARMVSFHARSARERKRGAAHIQIFRNSNPKFRVFNGSSESAMWRRRLQLKPPPVSQGPVASMSTNGSY